MNKFYPPSKRDKYCLKDSRDFAESLADMKYLIRTSALWDEDWYCRHFRLNWNWHDPLTHFLETWREHQVSPSAAFDICKYLAAYPEAAMSRLNPLVRYLSGNRCEKIWAVNEEFNKKKIFSGLRLEICNTAPGMSAEHTVAIYAASCADFKIDDEIIFALECLQEIADLIIFVADTYLPFMEINKLVDNVDCILTQNQKGGTKQLFADGIALAKKNGYLEKCGRIAFTDSSVIGFGPGLVSLMERVRADGFHSWRLLWQDSDVTFPLLTICAPDEIARFMDKNAEPGSVSQKMFLSENDFGNARQEEINAGCDIILSQTGSLSGYRLLCVPRNILCNPWKNGTVNIKKWFVDAECGTAFDNLVSSALCVIHAARFRQLFFSIIAPISIKIIEIKQQIETFIVWIDSLLAQDCQNFELLITVEGKQDKVEAILQPRFSAQLASGKLKLVTLARASRPYEQRNEILKVARGDWLLFPDITSMPKVNWLKKMAIDIILQPEQSHRYAWHRSIFNKPKDIILTIVYISQQHPLTIATLASALAQTGDFSQEIVIWLEEGKSNLILDRQLENLLMNFKIKIMDNDAARLLVKNTEASTAAFLLGGDIWLTPLKLEKQIDYLRHMPSCGQCCHGYYSYAPKKDVNAKDCGLPQCSGMADLPAFSTMMLAKRNFSAVAEHMPDLAQDNLWFKRMGIASGNIVCLPMKAALVRVCRGQR